jgi:hypothetical protein
MSTETTNDTTSVKEVDMDLGDLNSFLAIPGSESVLIPTDQKDTVFTKKTVDTTFLDNPPEDDEKDKVDETGKIVPLTAAASTTTLDAIVNTVDDEFDVDDDKKSAGRSKIDKSGLVELAKKLIDEGVIFGFEDDKPLDKYTQADFEDLLKTNFTEKERKVKETIPMEFFDSLSPELQYIAKYEADGGKDMKGMFRALAEVEETRALDPKNERDQEKIIIDYLTATKFGTREDIQEEVDAWRENEQLEAKALKFKPKLDAMQEEVVEQKLALQAQTLKQQQVQARNYMDNVYKVLEPAEINGITLDKRTQSMLYAGLVQPNYPSISGKNTNLLGHLLEKYQFVEPNHGLIAEALWLLADPEGYKTKVKEIAIKDTVTKTVRTLKNEEAKKISSVTANDSVDDTRKIAVTKIKRQEQSFFKR